MQAADDVQFRDADLQRLARLADNFLDGKLEAIRVAFLARERTELARKDAVVRIVDVAIDDVARAVADLALPDKICDGADGVQVSRFKEPEGVGIGDAFIGDNLVVNVTQLATLNDKTHDEQ